jgi:hypothetical protein
MALSTLALTASTREGLLIRSSDSSHGWSGCLRKVEETRARGGMLCIGVSRGPCLNLVMCSNCGFDLFVNKCFKFSVLFKFSAKFAAVSFSLQGSTEALS